MTASGICYLVGAGPGDPGLVTLRAKECIEAADVLVYDALSSPELLRWTKPGCEKIYVGKRAKDHALPQDKINELIVEKSQQGKSVVRLKGGDPMIFGRGGEEAAELAAAGVPFEIVPGISSAIGGPSYAGIPVTHRDHNTQLTIFTGHEDPTKGFTSVDYAQLAKTPGTKVFLMGVSRLREIANAFIEHGAEADTPIALTRWATTGSQWTIEGTLTTIADIAESVDFSSPAVAVIGNVVKERSKINWFETRPLFGKKIVVTRTREQAGELSKNLRNLGADVIELPTIRIEPPEDKLGFAEMVTHAHEYDWLVFTSPNGVEKFFEAFFATYGDARSLGNPRIAAIGAGTAAKIQEYRFTVDLIPKRFVAEGLIEAFENESVENLTMLWVKAEETRDIIGKGLEKLGAIVDECIAYRTVAETEDLTGARAKLVEQGADMITFTSSSTVDHFFNLGLDWPDDCVAASIGPVTGKNLRSKGMPPAVEATQHDIPGLTQAIVDYFKA
ncbi:uroporphyrinogen-III C-methyltransferase [Luteolibacter pohnpeiensis]|uniref:uroporphyrinogen-III C-methyltransferase n=1 Tax=Luteolibacter pohnpeiensis TaxID=454153 RepID=A0A934S6A4_9BACT|nr:uroporphyrinogen-III C-methyltransferase [Luteolibacter pohnpeiensis]MBK1883406.1 uroporphyrinogen-III C-methyltransferase [Luteolibacter pohnpeiensis]